jgi:ABC-type polysaccharide/polyol phosphate export permease
LIRIIKDIFRFLKHLIDNKQLLLALSENDFKEQFLGSYLGIFWAILRPILFMIIVWFIFSVGFKGHLKDSEIPFVLYLMCGYIPWFFFSDAVSGGMNSVISNKYLVKKVNFRVSILPIVKIVSVLFLHIIFLVILIVILFLYGYSPTVYWIQLPFYTFMMFVLVLGISWFTSALRVFMKDISQIISVILQLGFWITPIFWSISVVPEKYAFILNLNPMVYIVEGYRNTFLSNKWFWESTEYLTYFLFITLFFFLLGIIVFRRLRPHFGDVL